MIAHHALAFARSARCTSSSFRRGTCSSDRNTDSGAGEFPATGAGAAASRCSRQLRLDLAIPLGGAGLKILWPSVRHIALPKLRRARARPPRDRRSRFEILVQLRLWATVNSRLIQIVEGLAKMNEHQIAFVPEHGEEPGGCLLILLHIAEQVAAVPKTCFFSAECRARSTPASARETSDAAVESRPGSAVSPAARRFDSVSIAVP